MFSGRALSTKKKYHWEENTGIKPASHQITRHSSSCSLASGPASPSHYPASPKHSTLSSISAKIAQSHASLPTSPTHSEVKVNHFIVIF